MPDALLIDTAGGANFGDHDLRNVSTLHVGGSALSMATFEVTGTSRFNGAVDFIGGITSVLNPSGNVQVSSSLPGGIAQIGVVNGTYASIGAGTDGRVGFFGSAPLVKQTVTGSRGGNAALQSLLERLAAIGLIINNST